jgi:hypothetical protein
LQCDRRRRKEKKKRERESLGVETRLDQLDVAEGEVSKKLSDPGAACTMSTPD